MNKRHYEHTLPNIRGSLSNTYPYAGYALNLQKLKAYNRFMFPLAMALNRKL